MEKLAYIIHVNRCQYVCGGQYRTIYSVVEEKEPEKMKTKIILLVLTLVMVTSTLCTTICATNYDDEGYLAENPSPVIDPSSAFYELYLQSIENEKQCGMMELFAGQTRKLNYDLTTYADVKAKTKNKYFYTYEYVIVAYFTKNGDLKNFTASSIPVSFNYEIYSTGVETLGFKLGGNAIVESAMSLEAGGYTNSGEYDVNAIYEIEEFAATATEIKVNAYIDGFEGNDFKVSDTVDLPSLYFTDEIRANLTECEPVIYVGNNEQSQRFLLSLKNGLIFSREELGNGVCVSYTDGEMITCSMEESEKATGVLRTPMWSYNGVGPEFSFWIYDGCCYHDYALEIYHNEEMKQRLQQVLLSMSEYEDAIQAVENDPNWFSKGIGNISISTGCVGRYDISVARLNEDANDIYISKYCNEMNSLEWTFERALTDISFDDNFGTFSKKISINLADYVEVVAGAVYKFVLRDVTSGEVLDFCYCLADCSYPMNEMSKQGVVEYLYYENYDKYDGVIYTHVVNDDGSVSAGGYRPNEVVEKFVLSVTSDDRIYHNNTGYNGDVSDNKLDILEQNQAANFAELSALVNTAFTGVGNFFQICWGFLPSAYMSIIVAAAGALIILRLMGR